VGVSTVTADVSSIRTGSTAVALTTTGGPWTVGGVTYNYRSASTTANVASEGTKAFTVKATDANANSTTQNGFSAVMDNTVPTASDIQTANASGGVVGAAEAGDTITFTFSEPMDPDRILAAWTGASTSVTVRLANGGGGDTVAIWNAGNTAQLPLGSVNLGRTDYLPGGTRTFTTSAMVMSGSTITITLGTPSGGVGTAAGTGTMVWTPSTTAWDWASNAVSAATASESGAADKEF
jgi:hypothetical protein